ncbi:hypothetical protein DFJ74DRAFT_307968 [Hyaloraphidium curvatum]|nr:hypothetical protein DFJ74DRAFT_307968 [Hyaloraphidium curvatum]
MERFRLGRKAAKDPAPPIEVDAKWAIGTKAAEAMEPQEAIALMKRRAAELNGSAVDAEVPNGGVPAAGEAELEVESAGGSADTVGVATDVASAPGAPGAQSIPLPGEELPADATLRVRTVDPGTSGISGSGSFVVAMDGGPPPPSQTERTLGQITGTRQRRMRTRPWTRRAPNLTPEEWLALFPAPAPPFSVLGTGEDEIEDPAAALREANPLTRKSILRETESSSMMHFIFSVSIFLMPWNSKWLVRSALFFLCYFGVILFLWTSNGGTLGSLQLAGVTIAAAVELLAAFVGLPIVLATFRRLEEAAKTKSDAKASEYDLWPVASYVRWSELVRSSSCSPTDEEPTAYNSTSALLAHDPEDKLCPCPRPSCMGSLGDSFARLRLLQVVTHIVVLGVYEVFRFFTPLFTLGSAAWWGLMLAILAGRCLAARWTMRALTVACCTPSHNRLRRAGHGDPGHLQAHQRRPAGPLAQDAPPRHGPLPLVLPVAVPPRAHRGRRLRCRFWRGALHAAAHAARGHVEGRVPVAQHLGVGGAVRGRGADHRAADLHGHGILRAAVHHHIFHPHPLRPGHGPRKPVRQQRPDFRHHRPLRGRAAHDPRDDCQGRIHPRRGPRTGRGAGPPQVA